MGWKTYLVMYFGTGNGNVTETVKKVESVGFVSALGPVDFIYDWGNQEPTKEQVLELGDRTAAVLKGTNAIFNLDTHD
jgi:hypothetical protein